MPKARNDWSNKHGPVGCGYLDFSSRKFTFCKSLPNSKRD